MSRNSIGNIQNRIHWYDAVYAALIALVSSVCFQLFGRMIIVYQDNYHSDMRFYVRYAADDSNQHWSRLTIFVFSKLHDIQGGTLEINIYLALVIAAIIVVNYLVIRFYLKNEGVEPPRYVIQGASLAALFMSPIYLPGIHEYFYRFSFDTFAWHSPTQQSMVLFSLIASICFLKMFLDYENQIHPRWWLATAVTIGLSAWSKPSFFINLAITVVVLFLIELAVNHRNSFLSRLRRLFIMGCTLLPAGLYMILMNKHEYGAEESEDKVVFGFVNTFAQPHIKTGFICGLAFALVVCAINIGLLKDRKYRFAAGIFFAGVFQWLFFHEEGPRAAYGNFSWGRDYGDYYLILISVTIAILNWYSRDRFMGGKKIPQCIYFLIIGGLFLAHLLCGLLYFTLILTGHGYYI